MTRHASWEIEGKDPEPTGLSALPSTLRQRWCTGSAWWIFYTRYCSLRGYLLQSSTGYMLHALFHFVFVRLESLFAAWPKGREQLCPRCYTHTHHSFGVALVSHTALTHNFLTHTTLSHIADPGTWCGRRGIWWHWCSLCVAGVAFGDMDAQIVPAGWHWLRGRAGFSYCYWIQMAQMVDNGPRI